ncbi:hypothetical protein DMUE_5484 [Dictyocoela muelleri]|nr:hypothetical protein DMUE_5484 [Dictyocoela muelleri]
MKNKKLNILEKSQIADIIAEKNLKLSEVTKKFDITKSCALNIFNNIHDLTVLNKTDEILINRYNLSNFSESKYNDLEAYLRDKITRLRNKSIVINKQVIKEISESYYRNRSDLTNKVTDY